MKPHLIRGFLRNAILCLVMVACALSSARLAAVEIESPEAGTPLRKAILDALRTTDMFTQLSRDWHSPIVFVNVKMRVAGEWAWVVASPTWSNGKNTGEPVRALMRKKQSTWTFIDAVGDEVNSAENFDAAYKAWRLQLLKENSGCPADLVPTR